MSLEQEKFWFNQQFLLHKDLIFEKEKNKTLEINMSCNTSNYKEFTSPNINFVLNTVAKRYQIGINYQQVLEINFSLKEMLDNFNSCEDGYSIYKNYLKRNLKISIKQTKSGEKCIIFSIIYNESDFNYIILQKDIIITINKLLTDYINNYININFQFVNRSLITENLQQLRALNESILSLPFKLSNEKTNKLSPLTPSGFTEEEIADSKSYTNIYNIQKEEEIFRSDLNMELETFMNGNLDKINIPEIEKIKNTDDNEKNNLSLNLLKFFDNISELDSFIISLIPHEDRFTSWFDFLTKKLKIDKLIDSSKEIFLPGISDKDYKSLVYLSKTFFDTNLKRYIEKSGKFKTIMAIKKYKIEEDKRSLVVPFNNELSIEFLLIMCYLREITLKLETRETDVMRNKSILYVLFRTVSDPLIFSFITFDNKVSILNMLKERFEILKTNGFFQNFDDLLKNYSLSPVDIQEINNSANSILQSFEKSSKYIEDLHVNFYENKKVFMPYNCDFSLEQIINIITKLETLKNIDIDFSNIEELSKKLIAYNIKYDKIPKEILKLYINDNPNNNIRNPNMKSYEKFIREHIDEIPEDLVTSVLNYFIENQNSNIDITGVPFDLNNFGENILKLFYVWKPLENHKLIKQNELQKRIEDVILNKDELLLLANKEISENETEIDLGVYEDLE